MRRTILAAETEKAINRIRAAVEAQGATLALPPARGDADHRQLALLRAVADALDGGSEPQPSDEQKPVEVEPVEAIISVVGGQESEVGGQESEVGGQESDLEPEAAKSEPQPVTRKASAKGKEL